MAAASLVRDVGQAGAAAGGRVGNRINARASGLDKRPPTGARTKRVLCEKFREDRAGLPSVRCATEAWPLARLYPAETQGHRLNAGVAVNDRACRVAGAGANAAASRQRPPLR